MTNVFEAIKTKCIEIVEESSVIKTFVLECNGVFEFETGQFVEVGLPGIGEGPFTPSSSQYVKNPIEVTIMKAGYMTGKIHEIKPGETVTLRGPYGNGYPLGEFKGKDILIVGGGVGLAPLRSLLLTLMHNIDDYRSITVCFGARTPEDLIYKNQLKEWEETGKIGITLSVDSVPENQEWEGNVGVVTTLLKPLEFDVENTVAAVCGPPIMMKFTSLILLEKRIKPSNLYLSMESKMYCGIGLCRHCTIEHYFVCKDGPVFTYDQFENPGEIWA